MIIKLPVLFSIEEGGVDCPAHGCPVPSAAGSGWCHNRPGGISNGIILRLTSSHGAAWGLYLETVLAYTESRPRSPWSVSWTVAMPGVLQSLCTGHVAAQAGMQVKASWKEKKRSKPKLRVSV